MTPNQIKVSVETDISDALITYADYLYSQGWKPALKDEGFSSDGFYKDFDCGAYRCFIPGNFDFPLTLYKKTDIPDMMNA